MLHKVCIGNRQTEDWNLRGINKISENYLVFMLSDSLSDRTDRTHNKFDSIYI